MRNFQNERIVIGAMAMGEAQAAIELTLDWVTQRQAFGEPLWSKQTIRQRMAMLASRVEAGKQLVYHAAWLVARGIDATKEVSMVKADRGELVNEVMYPACSSMAAWATCARARSSECPATRGCSRSAAAPPK